ncbi:MAG: hypothetical protein H0W78_14850 [Planctomycetes bacterium]|nr:hypothetical protein [Planctomycetota bacterium]
MPPETLLVQPPRRRSWWRTLAVLTVVGVLVVVGGVWWALATNQTGNLISYEFSDRLPGRLEIDHSEFNGLEQLVLSGVRLKETSGSPAAVTIERVVVSGQLWKAEVDHIRIEGMHLHATTEVVRFLQHLIKAENAIPGSSTPRLIKLEFTGGVSVGKEVVIDGAQVAVSATGPHIAVLGSARYTGAPVTVQIETNGSGDQRTYRVALLEGQLPVWRSCDWLADLELLPRLPQESREWVPEFADLKGTVVVADRLWEHFSGEAKVAWKTGRGQADLQIDHRFVRLGVPPGRLIIRDDTLGSLDGQALIDTDANTVAVTATSWSPGPRLPIPSMVPTKEILAAMPQAQFDGTLQAGAWQLALRLSGTGEAILTSDEGAPLRIVGRSVALPLLQPFLPAELTLAAGNATTLNVEFDDTGLREVSGTVEQARVLWQGWALGSLEGKVGLKVVPAGIDLDLSLPALGKATWRAAPQGGDIALEITSAEALVARLKGPQPLPELSGAVSLAARIRQGDVGYLADVDRLALKQVGITDVLRTLDGDLSGTVRLLATRTDAHLLGRITSGELRIPGGWRDLAKRRPRFNAEVSYSNGVFLGQNILVRATDEATGEALIDGYSAGLRGRFSLTDLTGTIIGVVDHADLGWINTLVPVADGVMGGEGAVTFTAQLMRSGISSIDGYFLPLDARLHLGKILSATGIKGSVKFRIARPGDEAPSPK